MICNSCFFVQQDGMMFEGRFSESLSLVDAVMPDVVLAKQQQLREKVAALKLKKEQEKQMNVDEKMSQNNGENAATNVLSVNSPLPPSSSSMTVCTSPSNSVASMTTTVVTAATSTTNIKQQEPQTNGDHSIHSKCLLFTAVDIIYIYSTEMTHKIRCVVLFWYLAQFTFITV